MATLRAQFELPPNPASAGAGRRAVFQVLSAWDVPAETVDDTVLIVSELVTNAVIHAPAEPPLGLELSVRDGVLRVALSDYNPAPPRRRSPSGQDEGGRGIGILESLASRWGVVARRDGKALWFEIDLVA